MWVYNFIYNSIYRFLRLFNNPIPAFSTIMAMSLLFCFNLISIIVFLDLPDNTFVFQGWNFEILVIIVFASHYILFSINNKNEKIIIKFESESKKSKILGSSLVIAYTVITLYLYFYYAIPNTKIVPLK